MTEVSVRLAQKLTREEIEELARLVGPEARGKWWYRLARALPHAETHRRRGRKGGREVGRVSGGEDE